MSPYPSRFGATLAINVKCLCAFGLGWISWRIWPDTAEGWGLGVLSIMIAAAAVFSAADAVKLMARVYQRDKAVHDYLAQGRAPKSSKIASDDQLANAGMR